MACTWTTAVNTRYSCGFIIYLSLTLTWITVFTQGREAVVASAQSRIVSQSYSAPCGGTGMPGVYIDLVLCRIKACVCLCLHMFWLDAQCNLASLFSSCSFRRLTQAWGTSTPSVEMCWLSPATEALSLISSGSVEHGPSAVPHVEQVKYLSHCSHATRLTQEYYIQSCS